MATATQTKPPQPTTAPKSDGPPAGSTTKRGDKPASNPTTKALLDAGYVLQGENIGSENDDTTPDTTPSTTTRPDWTAPDSAEAKTSSFPQGNFRVRPLSKQDAENLELYEAAIDEGLPKFFAVGEALFLIREKKLFRTQYRTFEEYCEKRFGISRQSAYLQIGAAEVTENLSTNGLQIPAGTTERVLRPLAKQTAEVQVEAWKLAQAKAAGKKISGKDVEDALKEVLSEQTQQQTEQDWFTRTRDRFSAAGYLTDFDQPVSVGNNEWIDFKAADQESYVKLIDRPALSTWGICVAMRENGLDYRVIVNANNLRKTGLTLAKDGTLTHLLEPGLIYFVHLLGAYVERDGKVYEPDLFERGYRLKLKRASTDDPTELEAATNTEEMPQTSDQ